MALFGRDPDILFILRDLQALLVNQAQQQAQILKAIATLSAQATQATSDIEARLDQIEADLNPPYAFIPPLAYWSTKAMAFVTSINLVAGGSADDIVCQDSSPTPKNFPNAQTSWAPTPGVNVVSDADGITFHFTAAASTAAGAMTTQATWTDPIGVQPPIVGPVMTIDVTTAVVPPTTFVPPMQYSETSGA